MRIGYPCINRGVSCQGARTFRLRSYSEERLIAAVRSNLDCLAQVLRYNHEHDLLFFRVTSELVPFASHPICTFDWQAFFAAELEQIGQYARKHDMRISMHPDQFTLINALDASIVDRSIQELAYHAEVLDGMGLDLTAKIQIHIGGVYGDKVESLRRFVAQYRVLDSAIRRRLVVENDERSFGLQDCLEIHRETGVPVLLDTLHHAANSQGEPLEWAAYHAAATWAGGHGPPMVDYSTQKPGGKPGQHAEHIDEGDFGAFLTATEGIDPDVMLEIKDKESSALTAAAIAARCGRLWRAEDGTRALRPQAAAGGSPRGGRW